LSVDHLTRADAHGRGVNLLSADVDSVLGEVGVTGLLGPLSAERGAYPHPGLHLQPIAYLNT
jgi:hypothetical protein